LNIYIYGSKRFVKNIDTIITNNHIKTKLNGGIVKVIDDVAKLKFLIQSNPKDIYLIENNMILTKNIFSNLFNVINKKKMITKEFLIKYGLGDFSIDEQEDIGIHIIKRLDNLDQTIYKSQNNINNNGIEQIEDNNYKNDNEVITTINDIQKNKGDIMSDLTQLDEITEIDLLDALSNIDGIDVESSGETIKVTSSQKDETEQKHTIEVDSSNMDSIASLLEQLMNNKTLEISIKVKN